MSKFIFGFARRIRRGFLVVRGCFSFRIKEEKKKRYLQENVYKRKLKNFMKKRFVKKKEVNLIKKLYRKQQNMHYVALYTIVKFRLCQNPAQGDLFRP